MSAGPARAAARAVHKYRSRPHGWSARSSELKGYCFEQVGSVFDAARLASGLSNGALVVEVSTAPAP
jgi:hypothetical protein